ncbi:nitrite reductase [Skermanella stibiiresistens SB22]|uniref:Nitrite reductase n=1 Tax=Skermanella stibiiresistens SB22 TaxID=1385369 RepID=W9GZZ7_9PROT|nr:nitrite reductase small subunit NirD [Skermanella stibiiresistens]EWY39389.1 nitrite reductase [Skermanella stibiiresistens SB22]
MAQDISSIDVSWIEVGKVADIPPAGARVVKSSQGDIAVFRTADDAVFAVRDRCPHAGGPLSQGIVHDARVTCPLHNWVIDLASGAATGPDEGCAGTYPVRVEDGVILLGLKLPAAAA